MRKDAISTFNANEQYSGNRLENDRACVTRFYNNCHLLIGNIQVSVPCTLRFVEGMLALPVCILSGLLLDLSSDRYSKGKYSGKNFIGKSSRNDW